MYRIRLLDSAIRDLARLDKTVARRIVKRLDWLAENLELIRCDTLTADLAEYKKFRVGDYRVLYQVLQDEQLILIHAIGHRREIYRRK